MSAQASADIAHRLRKVFSILTVHLSLSFQLSRRGSPENRLGVAVQAAIITRHGALVLVMACLAKFCIVLSNQCHALYYALVDVVVASENGWWHAVEE